MKGPISFAVFLVIIAWGIYRCYQIKKERYFQGLLAVCIFQLQYYPLWLPAEFVFSGFCLLGCGALLYKVCFQKQDKNLLMYSGIFLFCCAVFFIQGLARIDSAKMYKGAENKPLSTQESDK
jgi:CDP-diglyceride synthetase